jgi:RNA polymerase sigma factor (sigma-70 family)
VLKYILQHGGSHQDAQDVFQESIVILDKSIREGRFEGRSTVTTYFVGIAKWHWVTLRRQRGRLTNYEAKEEESLTDGPDVQVIQAEEREMLQNALNQLGGRCKELLTYYQLDYSMQEIAVNMQYENADVAKKEAYRCRNRLREVLVAQGSNN